MTDTCAPCSDAKVYITPTIFVIIGLTLVALAVLVAFHTPLSAYYERRKDRITQLRDQGTMIFVTLRE